MEMSKTVGAVVGLGIAAYTISAIMPNALTQLQNATAGVDFGIATPFISDLTMLGLGIGTFVIVMKIADII